VASVAARFLIDAETLSALRAVHDKDVCWLNFGVQFNVILPAAPGVTRVVQ